MPAVNLSPDDFLKDFRKTAFAPVELSPDEFLAEHRAVPAPASNIPGMEQIGAPPPAAKPPLPGRLAGEPDIEQVQREIQQEMQHPETAPPERRGLVKAAGRHDTGATPGQPTAEDLISLGLMTGTTALGEAAVAAKSIAARRTLAGITNALGLWFSKGMVESAGQHAKDAYEAYKKNDTLGAVRMLGAGSIEAGMGVLGLREGFKRGFVLQPKESYLAQQESLPPSQRDIGAGGMRGPIEPEVVSPEPTAKETPGLKPGPATVEAEPPIGASYETTTGTATVLEVKNGRVKYETKLPGSGAKFTTTRPLAVFQKTVAGRATQAPVAPQAEAAPAPATPEPVAAPVSVPSPGEFIEQLRAESTAPVPAPAPLPRPPSPEMEVIQPEQPAPVTPQAAAEVPEVGAGTPVPVAEPTEQGKIEPDAARAIAGATQEGEPLSGSREPSHPVAQGETTQIRVPGREKPYQAHYAVRELADIQPSHNPFTFERNPDYHYLNDRDYSDPVNQARPIHNSGAAFDPSYLITDNPDATNGPSIIERNGNVLGGNNRAITMTRVYAQNPAGAKAYRELLAKRAANFGIDPALVEKMDKPVLVREIDEAELDPQRAITDLNKTPTAQLSTGERATADARSMTPETAKYIGSILESAGPDASLTDALNGKHGPTLLNRLIREGLFTEEERPELFDSKTGTVTKSAKERVAKMLLGNLFEDSDQFQRAEPSLRNKLERIAPLLKQIESNPEWNLLPAVKEAVRLIDFERDYVAAHGFKATSSMAQQQEDMFGNKPPEVSAQARHIADVIRTNSPLAVAQAFRSYVEDSTSTNLLAQVTPGEGFARAFGNASERGTAGAAGRHEPEAGNGPAKLRADSVTAQKKLTPAAKAKAARERLRDIYTPGNIVTGYGGYRDRVVSIEEGVNSFGIESPGSFRVQVQELDKNGNPVGEPRWHSTPPDKSTIVISRSSERGAAPMLTDLLAALERRFKSDAPKANYSHLGGVKRIALPGRRLNEVEAANPAVFEAAINAASSQAKASLVMRSALPAIHKALKETEYSAIELRQAYMESRLRGIHDRWLDFANQAEDFTDDELAAALQKTAGGDQPNALISLLSNIEGRQGMAQDLGQTAVALLEQQNFDTLRGLLSQTFSEAANRVASVMPDEYFQEISNSIRHDPHVAEAHRIYKDSVESEMSKSHALNEGIFSDALGPLDTYFPLIPVDRPQTQPVGRRLPYHKPRNISNAFATGLSDMYDSSTEAFAKKLAAAIRGNDKANLIRTMEQAGWAMPEPQGWDGTFEGPDGVTYKGVREEASGQRTIINQGKIAHAPARFIIMPQFMNTGLRPILAREPADANDIVAAMKWANSLAITWTPMELAFHGTGVLGSIASNTPFLGPTLLDKVLSVPVLRWFTIRGKMLAINPTTPENIKKLQEMARAGAVPTRSGEVSLAWTKAGREYAEMTGAKKTRVPFSAALYGPKGLDARARILMYDIFRAVNPGGTPAELHHFVNQIGNYTPELQGEIERWLKHVGVGTFATAGMTRIVNGIHAYDGTGPMPDDKKATWFKWLLTGSGWMTLALWFALYKAVTGKDPIDDKRAKLFQIPVGGGSGPIDALRYSSLGRARWGDGPEVGYLNFAFFNPGALRGARAMGAVGAFEAATLGGNKFQVGEAVAKDIANTASHPVLGPAIRSLFVLGTANEPYVTGFRDNRGRPGLQLMPAIPQKLKRGFVGGFAPIFASGQPVSKPGFAAQAGARSAAALRELNGFYADIGEHTGMLGPDRGERGAWYLRMMMDLATTGLVTNASNPYKRAQMLRNQRTGTGR
jgi:hypothetical protein